MQLEYTKVTLAGVWVIAGCLLGLAADISSASAWTVLAGVALVPPVLMLKLWHSPPQTITQSINEAIR